VVVAVVVVVDLDFDFDFDRRQVQVQVQAAQAVQASGREAANPTPDDATVDSTAGRAINAPRRSGTGP